MLARCRGLILVAAAFLVLAPAVRGQGQEIPEPVRVELTTSDGIRIAGWWLGAYNEKAPAALLLHNHGADHYAFRPLYQQLYRRGIHVLAIDFRGHGASRKLAPEKYDALVARDVSVYREMALDAEAGLRFLAKEKGVSASRVAVIGGELGANVGLDLMGRQPKLAGMVALSPGLLDYGLDTVALTKKYGKRPILIVTSKRLVSTGPQQVADALQKTAPVQLEIWPGANVRGVQMLGQPANIEGLILAWFENLFPDLRQN